jgi:hypothetical protein
MQGRNIADNALPEGLRRNERLDAPILTPTTKLKRMTATSAATTRSPRASWPRTCSTGAPTSASVGYSPGAPNSRPSAAWFWSTRSTSWAGGQVSRQDAPSTRKGRATRDRIVAQAQHTTDALEAALDTVIAHIRDHALKAGGRS